LLFALVLFALLFIWMNVRETPLLEGINTQENTRLIQENARLIQEQKTLLNQTNKVLLSLQEVQQKNEKIVQDQEKLQEKNEKLQEKNEQLQEKNKQLQEKSAELMETKQSSGSDKAEVYRTTYLDLLRDTLTGIAFLTTERAVTVGVTTNDVPMKPESRRVGLDWPRIGISMIGVVRMDNLRSALYDVTKKNIPGDFVECGVWRGGASIFATGFLKINEIKDRKVWVVDSFDGLPLNRTNKDDANWYDMEYLKVSTDLVMTNFKGFHLWDESMVTFVKGYFVDSLPYIKVQKIAVLRMDGDMYESTLDQLFNLYDKVEVGGWVIIDDWSITVCKTAINDFRRWHGMTEEIRGTGDNVGAYFIKEKQVTIDWTKYWPILGTKTHPKKPATTST
jgi:O-methyltransferase